MIVTVLRQQGHNRGGGAALAQALGVPHAPPTARRTTRQGRLIINWGVSDPRIAWLSRGFFYSNTPQAVANCANKLECFNLLIRNQVRCVGATWPGAHYLDGTKEPAWDERNWLEEDGKIVVRRVLNGHSGAGIQIVRRGEPIPEAPLYTRYFKKNAEYRVHVAFGRVILIQQKRKENGYDGANNPLHELVRTHANGWIFCVNDLSCDLVGYRADIERLAVSACAAVGANHAAVDILVRHRTNARTTRFDDAAVVEINSAPAIRANSTLEAYTAAFRTWINDRSGQIRRGD